jgi:hypothetical protein
VSAEVASNAAVFLSTNFKLDAANCDKVGKFVEECALWLAERLLGKQRSLSYVNCTSGPEASNIKGLAI